MSGKDTWKTCPECGHFGERATDICINCREKQERPDWHTCPNCGHFGRRNIDICKKCANIGKLVCPQCGNPKSYKSTLCRKCSTKNNYHNWTEDELSLLKTNYSTKGAKWIAKILDRSYSAVLNRASKLKLTLNKETYQSIVHDKASQFLKEHNPSKQSGASERLAKQSRENTTNLTKLIEAHALLRKDKPTKLEFKLCAILDSFSVKYEHQFVIKAKFIVDIIIGDLIIEADGDWWHGHIRFAPFNQRQLSQQARDRSRNAYLLACGYKIERIWESDMNAETVKNILLKHGLLPSPILYSTTTVA